VTVVGIMAPTIACVASKEASPFMSPDVVDVVPAAETALSLLSFPVLEEAFAAGGAIVCVLADAAVPLADEGADSVDSVGLSSVEERGVATDDSCDGGGSDDGWSVICGGVSSDDEGAVRLSALLAVCVGVPLFESPSVGVFSAALNVFRDMVPLLPVCPHLCAKAEVDCSR
jgi:hypothetical protein